MKIDDERANSGRPVLALAGASGFVGQALLDAFAATYPMVGLTRAAKRTGDPRATWRRCDLYSLLEVERALEGANVAIYLVHSMSSSARLTQANFADLDLILADNFARACASRGITRILYVGGIVSKDDQLSRHLQSRLEVEQTLASHGAQVTALRAGLIVGKGGSSLNLMLRLIRRLPFMVCPRWTQTMTQPIALGDVTRAVRLSLEDETLVGHFDIGGPDTMSYQEMMERTAKVLGLPRTMVKAPVFSMDLSKLWVSLVGGTPLALVGPLLESLRHDVLVSANRLQDQLEPEAKGFEAALRSAIGVGAPESTPSELRREPKGTPSQLARTTLAPTTFPQKVRHPSSSTPPALVRALARKTVRSVQRLPRPCKRSADWIAGEYVRWLPHFLWPLLTVKGSPERRCRFYLLGTTLLLLELTFSADRSQPDRTLFYVTGGSLARVRHPPRGRFEFRQALNSETIVAAVHDFESRLPWFIYKNTQAIVHLIVMRGFSRHLQKLSSKEHPPGNTEEA
ncbi:MAG: NAD(P)H-binding protein [Myxococcota bacterium]